MCFVTQRVGTGTVVFADISRYHDYHDSFDCVSSYGKNNSFFFGLCLFGIGASSFHSPRSPVLYFFYVPTPFSFMIFRITSLHLSFGLPIIILLILFSTQETNGKGFLMQSINN